MSVTITIHRGAATVGGSCIEVATERTRLILDIGLPLFDADRQPLDSHELRRMTSAELRAHGLLPQVAGLFDDQKSPDAILLSHAHLDHTGLLEHTPSDIPVYATVGASKMMLAGSLFAGQVALPKERFRELKPEQPITIGDLIVTPYSVDHSIFDCVALHVQGGGKSILYTGDLRLHGRKPGIGERLLNVFKGRALDVLIQEGTHFGMPDGNSQTEFELEESIVQQVKSAQSLVLASFTPQHVDRLIAFIRAAKKTGRVFVADVYSAFVLRLVASQIPVPRPGVSSELRVYFPEVLIKSAERRGLLERFQEMFQASRIEIDEIKAEPAKHLMVFRPSMLADFRGELPSGTNCIFSRWEGYLEGPEWNETKKLLAEKPGDGGGQPRIHLMHCSGHIRSQDVVRFVNALRPRMIIPVHTFCPEEFVRRFENARLARDGEVIEI